MRSTRKTIHQWIYIGGLTLLAIGLPSSVFLMSVSQIILFLNWLAEGNIHTKARRFFQHKAALIFASIYLVHIIALFYSSNWDYGISTLRTRLPIFLLTFVVVSSDPIPNGSKKWILLAFSAAITIVSFFSVHTYLSGAYIDYRELSPFISHIRLSLMVALSVYLLLYLARDAFRDQVFWSRLSFGLAAWHIIYLFLLHSLSGIIVFIAMLLVLAIKTALSRNVLRRRIAITGILLCVASGISLSAFLWQNVTREVQTDLAELDEYSAQGNPYMHDKGRHLRENGHLVYIYIAEEELRDAWNSRSALDFYGHDRRGDPIKDVLYRYMTSMGLRKDVDGLSRLSDSDVEAIEQGVTNVLYTHWPWMLTRLHQTMWELQHYRITGDPSGHTLSQRMAFWQAAWEAIRKKPLMGWGTGDIREAAHYGLQQIDSPLTFERWMKPHNQYLSFAVLFGIPGALWILFAMVYPAKMTDRFRHFPFLAFFVILSISMLNEDTIDTQAGLSFFVFFCNYFLFLKETPVKKPKEQNNGRTGD